VFSGTPCPLPIFLILFLLSWARPDILFGLCLQLRVGLSGTFATNSLEAKFSKQPVDFVYKIIIFLQLLRLLFKSKDRGGMDLVLEMLHRLYREA
jgi:hypothetical protein